MVEGVKDLLLLISPLVMCAILQFAMGSMNTLTYEEIQNIQITGMLSGAGKQFPCPTAVDLLIAGVPYGAF